MTRRGVFSSLIAPFGFSGPLRLAARAPQRRIAITMDDANWRAIPGPWSSEANERILSHLSRHGMKAGLFAVGMNVDNPRGREILESWNDAGHMPANHTWHHRLLSRGTAAELEQEALACEAALTPYSRFRRFLSISGIKGRRYAGNSR